MSKKERVSVFQRAVWNYYRAHKRDLPWRPPSLKLRKDGTADPYAILVSEVMLQQTQVERVIPKYLEWMRKFPSPESLATASTADVLKAWQGLGYNRRALNLKRAAKMLVREYGGVMPRDIEQIDTLPGVGPYTARAVAAFAFGVSSAFIETNIRTVFLHFFFNGKTKVTDANILEVIHIATPSCISTLQKEGSVTVQDWYFALMDYGAMLKRTVGNANRQSAHYAKQATFKGSKRELRGAILRKAAAQKIISSREFTSASHSIADTLDELVREGFLKKKGSSFTFA